MESNFYVSELDYAEWWISESVIWGLMVLERRSLKEDVSVLYFII